MTRKTIALIGGLLAAGLLATFVMNRELKKSRVAKMFGGKDGLMTVTHPTRVEAYRLKPKPMNDVRDITNVTENYEVSAGPVSMTATAAAAISADLVAPGSYEWDTATGCLPRYGVRLSFLHARDQVEVYLCFECQHLLVTRNGSVTGGGLFDPMNAILVHAAKTLFPNDAEIQKLKDN